MSTCSLAPKLRRSPRRSMSGSERREAEQAWAWVSPALASYKEWETATIRGGIQHLHVAQDSVRHSAEAARSTVVGTFVRAEKMIADANSHASRGARTAVASYPEMVVGGTAISFACAVGGSNGTLLGNAPKRTAFVALIAAFCLRSPLVTKWGDDCAALSGTLSEALKGRAASFGLLPTDQA